MRWTWDEKRTLLVRYRAYGQSQLSSATNLCALARVYVEMPCLLLVVAHCRCPIMTVRLAVFKHIACPIAGSRKEDSVAVRAFYLEAILAVLLGPLPNALRQQFLEVLVGRHSPLLSPMLTGSVIVGCQHSLVVSVAVGAEIVQAAVSCFGVAL